MKRVKLIVAYEGTNYCGWQVQPNAITVAGVINQTLSELLGEEIEIMGASRTDAGVHAMGNVAVFDTNSRIPGEKVSFALNQKLPEDIRIQHSEEVELDFHPRFCDSKKTYCYRIRNAMFPNPCKRHYEYFVHRDLHVEDMQKAAEYLVGTHDFKSFCSVYTQAKDTIRTVNYIKVDKLGDEISITVNGNGFLYNMVRIIVGTLIVVGKGLKKPEEVKTMLEGLDRSLSGPTAPAHGLMLMGIEYVHNTN